MKEFKIGNTYYYPGDTYIMDGIKIGDSYFTPGTLIVLIILILAGLFFIVVPILTLVEQHRVRNGKEPFNKGKVRENIIVKKRETEREIYASRYGFNRFGVNLPTDRPDALSRETSVDFRKVGGKILYTKSIDDELFDQMEVGKTYKVRIRDGKIINIY